MAKVRLDARKFSIYLAYRFRQQLVGMIWHRATNSSWIGNQEEKEKHS